MTERLWKKGKQLEIFKNPEQYFLLVFFLTSDPAFSFCTGPHILCTWPYRQLSLLLARCLSIKCLNPTGKVHKDATPPLPCGCLLTFFGAAGSWRAGVWLWNYHLLPFHNLAFSFPKVASVKRRNDSGKRMTPHSDCLMLTHSFNNRYWGPTSCPGSVLVIKGE